MRMGLGAAGEEEAASRGPRVATGVGITAVGVTALGVTALGVTAVGVAGELWARVGMRLRLRRQVLILSLLLLVMVETGLGEAAAVGEAGGLGGGRGGGAGELPGGGGRTGPRTSWTERVHGWMPCALQVTRYHSMRNSLLICSHAGFCIAKSVNSSFIMARSRAASNCLLP